MILIEDAGAADIPVIRSLAEKIWPAAYRGILSRAQIAYMMEQLYSHAALEAQIAGEHHFLIAKENDAPAGFADYGALPEPGVCKLHKIYVLPELQGKGIGLRIINEVITRARSSGAEWLELNVNRHNKARFFYEKLGFTIYDKMDIPIGEGYFMNDYVMRKSIFNSEL
ncbi:MAG TPA: GNAT family N-acetyltransferase [Chitinophagaceae bacterium]